MPIVRATVRCIGCDYHFFGLAIDVTFTDMNTGKQYNEKYATIADYEASPIVRTAKKYGFIWGGTFAGYYDPSHFDYRRHDLRVLEKAAIKKYGSLKKANIYNLW